MQKFEDAIKIGDL